MAYAEPIAANHNSYRPDIDGLRAVAVLSVVIYHAFPHSLRGGFVGVDVFFVISGFLISTIIFSNLERHSFSFLEFYARRIRRIFPALLVVLITTFAAGWFVLLASEYKELGKHIAAGAGFVSNLVLWSESGYFDTAAETKPLLHLWSLGIEEQFYLVWPLLLWIAQKKRLNLLTITVLVALVSFIFNAVGIHNEAVATFYSPITRFWELSIGSILAWLSLRRGNQPSKLDGGLDRLLSAVIWAHPHSATGATLNGIKSAIGILLIAIAVAITKPANFPGWWALLPTLGTVLVLSAGAHAWLNRSLLSNRIAVWFGSISYPLYLWHWPLLSFAHIVVGDEPTPLTRAVIVLVSILLAWTTYQFIEKPIRFSSQHTKGLKTAVVAILMTIFGGVGYTAYHMDGLPFRSIQANANETAVEMNYGAHWVGWSTCDIVHSSNKDLGGCMALDPSRAPDVVVIGDSHAGHLASGLKQYFAAKHMNVAVLLQAGCYPFYPIQTSEGSGFDCPGDLIKNSLDYAVSAASVKVIILSGYPALQIQKDRFSLQQDESKDAMKTNAAIFDKALKVTLSKLSSSGKPVVFMLDDPEQLKSPTACENRLGGIYEKKCEIKITKQAYLNRNALFLSIIQENKPLFSKVAFINPADVLCDDNFCYGTKGKTALYQSEDHLSPAGARYVFSGVSKQLDAVLDTAGLH